MPVKKLHFTENKYYKVISKDPKSGKEEYKEYRMINMYSKDDELLRSVVANPSEDIKRCEKYSVEFHEQIDCLKEEIVSRENLIARLHLRKMNIHIEKDNPDSFIFYQSHLFKQSIEQMLERPIELLFDNPVGFLELCIDLLEDENEEIDRLITEKVEQYKISKVMPPSVKSSELENVKSGQIIKMKHLFISLDNESNNINKLKLLLVGMKNIRAIELPRNNLDKYIKELYYNHFDIANKICCDGPKLNWIAPLTWFKYFYDLFYTEFFNGQSGLARFFLSHFLIKGQEGVKEKIEMACKGKRSYPPKYIQKRFDELLEKMMNLA